MYKISGLDLDKENRDGYVYGQSIRGADQEFKDWVLKNDYIIDKIFDDDGNETLTSKIEGNYATIKRGMKLFWSYPSECFWVPYLCIRA